MREDRSDPFRDDPEAELNVSSLIDVAFLLLAFFLVASNLVKQEADLGMALPGIEAAPSGAPVRIDQMTIRIKADGSIVVNQEVAETDPALRDVPDLSERLRRYAFSSQIAESEAIVIVQCDDLVPEQRFIDVLNACSKAGISNISLTE